MTLVWTRIDQKLIHGQIALAWVPHLKIDTIVVADREIKDNPRAQRFMKMGLPPEIQDTFFVDPDSIAGALERKELKRRRVLLIFKDMENVIAAVEAGLCLQTINLGYHACNAAEQTEAIRLGQTFYLCAHDLAGLSRLYAGGLEVILQSIPAEKAVRWSPAG
jgi:mannose/fructose/N-acetylgalactosamine-specific phosphotransferase system component IIB